MSSKPPNCSREKDLGTEETDKHSYTVYKFQKGSTHLIYLTLSISFFNQAINS